MFTFATDLFVVLGIAAATLTVTLTVAYVADREQALARTRRLRRPVAITVTATATAGSLFYSEIVGFVPCTLCWVQRGFMYPLTLVIAATYAKPAIFRPVALLLAAGGLATATYHYLLQQFPTTLGTAAACSTTTPCTAAYIWRFGFISLPLLAGVGFATAGALLILDHLDTKDRT